MAGKKAAPGAIAVHFGEIWLKGRNRDYFVSLLFSNVAKALKGQDCRLEKLRDRFIVRLGSGGKEKEIMERLSKVFGIAWFAPVQSTGNGMDEIVAAALAMLDRKRARRIVVNRTYKRLPYNSMELSREIVVQAMRRKLAVEKDSEDILYINIVKEGAMLYSQKTRGMGGLPVGASGRAVVLLSGGIDSPVAALYAMKRGLLPIYLHLHAFSNNKKAESSKIKRLLSILGEYSGPTKCYFAPAHIFQAAVLGRADRFELVMFKRFAYQMAEAVARRENAKVIVTGESLGQVASQTVSNLIATERNSNFLIMRPLIGFDKQEIINEARRLGTYEVSIEEYPDVCSITAKNPATAAKRYVIDRIYDECGLGEAVERTLKKASVKA
jgi:thiamine biosynthesis protein ThiI